MRIWIPFLLLAVLLVGTSRDASSQPATAPTVTAAEQAFDRGLRAYRASDYRAAYEAFVRAAVSYDFHQRTTAAALMAGKALYAAGEFEEAVGELTNFVASYPRSRYIDEARRVRRLAQDRMRERPAPVTVTSIGVVLPIGGDDDVFSQALFNGIRLAVDAHNAADSQNPVRLIFRSSGGGAVAAGDAVASLVRAGAEVVIGPLFSEEAIAAGGVAERERVVLIAPMATDGRVAANRRYVFQANPTFTARGQAMATYAANSGLQRVGVIAARNTFAEDMAQAFSDQAIRDGQEIIFWELLPSEEAWFQLPERIGVDRMLAVDAVYLPVAGADAADQASAALRGMEQLLGEDATRPRILANGEWINLAGGRERAERFGTVITTDFAADGDTAEHRDFAERYRRLSGVAPDRLAFAGYDVASLLLGVMSRNAGQDLADALRAAGRFNGLGHRIDFNGGQVNEALYLMRFRGGGFEQVR